MITSFKGGVGKSTVTANLAMALAMNGKRVLALDCDFNMRCLDLITGLESKVVYDVCDVCRGTVELSRAVLTDERSENFFFLSAPYSTDVEKSVEEAKNLREVLDAAKKEYSLDYILLDTPGDVTPLMPIVTSCADRAIIVASHAPASIRAAEKTSSALAELGMNDMKLIINNFDVEAVKKKKRPGIIEIIDRTYIQLIGVVPYSKRLGEMQESGSLIDSVKGTNVYCAFDNTAKRIIGHSVPLFSGFSSGFNAVKLK